MAIVTLNQSVNMANNNGFYVVGNDSLISATNSLIILQSPTGTIQHYKGIFEGNFLIGFINGTLTGFTEYQSNGTTLISDSTGFSVPYDVYFSYAEANDSFGLRQYALSGNDFIIGSSEADTLIGANGDDDIRAGSGNDWIQLDGGNDIFANGNQGNDTVHGGQNNDILYGETGDDFLYGDKGNDTIAGGSGGDIFVFTHDSGVDVITDFISGDILQIKNNINDTGIVDFSSLQNNIIVTDNGLEINLGNENNITLSGVFNLDSFDVVFFS